MSWSVRLACASVVTSLVAFPAWAPSTPSPKRTLVLAGGCFWGVEAVFEHLLGVRSVTSGYATPMVAADAPGPRRGIAEAVRVEYDPTQISYQQLLEVFFLVAHDPTQVDRQGPDVGPRYRSLVFAGDNDERRIAQGFIDSLREARVYAAPIATEVVVLRRFSIAENFHQNFVAHNPRLGYVIVNDLPKLVELRRRFPTLYRE